MMLMVILLQVMVVRYVTQALISQNYLKLGGGETYIYYGPTRSRYKTVLNIGSDTTTYYSGSYEKVVSPEETVEKVYVGNFAILEKRNGVQSTYHLIKDHLGSIVATVKSDGHEDVRFSFDPWGKRRTFSFTYDMLRINSISEAVTSGEVHQS